MQLRKDSLKAGGGQIDLLFLDRAENDGVPLQPAHSCQHYKVICYMTVHMAVGALQLKRGYAISVTP